MSIEENENKFKKEKEKTYSPKKKEKEKTYSKKKKKKKFIHQKKEKKLFTKIKKRKFIHQKRKGKNWISDIYYNLGEYWGNEKKIYFSKKKNNDK